MTIYATPYLLDSVLRRVSPSVVSFKDGLNAVQLLTSLGPGSDVRLVSIMCIPAHWSRRFIHGGERRLLACRLCW